MEEEAGFHPLTHLSHRAGEGCQVPAGGLRALTPTLTLTLTLTLALTLTLTQVGGAARDGTWLSLGGDPNPSLNPKSSLPPSPSPITSPSPNPSPIPTPPQADVAVARARYQQESKGRG